MKLPLAFLVLIGFQLIGEIVHRFLQLPLPGPVIGMFLLTAALILKPRKHSDTESKTPGALTKSADFLIAHMGLLFVPAGVGIMTETDLLRDGWIPLVAGVVGSTLLSLMVTGLVLHHLGKVR